MVERARTSTKKCKLEGFIHPLSRFFIVQSPNRPKSRPSSQVRQKIPLFFRVERYSSRYSGCNSNVWMIHSCLLDKYFHLSWITQLSLSPPRRSRMEWKNCAKKKKWLVLIVPIFFRAHTLWSGESESWICKKKVAIFIYSLFTCFNNHNFLCISYFLCCVFAASEEERGSMKIVEILPSYKFKIFFWNANEMKISRKINSSHANFPPPSALEIEWNAVFLYCRRIPFPFSGYRPGVRQNSREIIVIFSLSSSSHNDR